MTVENSYIEVAVAVPVYHTFTYSVPQYLLPFVAAGKRVLVPFGRRRVTGYILGSSQDCETAEIKHILDVLDEQPLFGPAMISFFQWISDYYKHPMGDVIKNALPGGLTLYDYASLTITPQGKQALKGDAINPFERAVLKLLDSGPCRLNHLSRKLNQVVPGALIQSLERKGHILKTRELRQASIKTRQERFFALADPVPALDRLSKPRKKIIDILVKQGEISMSELKRHVPTAARLVRALKNDGYLKVRHKRVYRDPFGEPIRADNPPVLNAEQQSVVVQIVDSLNNGFTTFLLQGVTGSGKTEVYMQVAAETLKQGKSVLVLVPEIALITQMERRFRARFGERIAVLHSGLSAGERYDQWSRILQQKADIAIGARSAIFAPFPEVGLIIVDEEHDSSYKQENNLRYNARDLAVVRAKLNDCVALLGSATPSIQSCYNALSKKFIQVNLQHRIERRPLPAIKIVDLRESLGYRGQQRFIAPLLQQAIKDTLDHRQQVLLFLNRRGFANFALCQSCGQPQRCKHCDISLTYHQKANAFKCHYCGFSRAATSRCDICGSSKIKKLGLGTEKIETTIHKLFPDARVARMDRDTTAKKGAIVKLLKGLKDQTIDILVGTQMVAKGHDFPNITLVGIICADLSLSFPDFRAGERTFQLLAQVAGRAGRGSFPGRVILQTYNPDHFSILAARDQDFDSFYHQEINFRKALNYPPFSRMIQLKISGKDPALTQKCAHQLGDRCRTLKTLNSSAFGTIEVMGPIESSLTKIARRYRWQILLKGRHVRALHQFVSQLLAENSTVFHHSRVRVVIDVDPVSLL
ncbi:MAG: primosomal protein N' [Desulfobacterales bacterium]|nr:primosomal protein N' [Desulfobacterales bacterium]